MDYEPKLTLVDRLVLSFVSGLTGAVYGVILAIGIAYFTHQFHSNLIVFSAVSFSCLGFFFGNFAGDATLALLHFLWGGLNGYAENFDAIEEEHPKGHLRSFLLLGFGTGLALLLWWHF